MKGFAQGVAELFANMKASAPADSKTGSGNAYHIIVQDESGAPVKGVYTQLCSDSVCYMGETDENGIATFNVDEGGYTVHVHKAPKGFIEDSTEYEVPGTYGDVTITLKLA